jgi:hypothetical protein
MPWPSSSGEVGRLFERAHHRDVALVLQSLDPAVLAARHCYFGGGTAMALRYGEYRESVDIDFLVSDAQGYRDLRQLLGGPDGLAPMARGGLQLAQARDLRIDQYGIRTLVRAADTLIKFEIVREARIELAPPGPADEICGIATLSPLDMAAEKLLANADRWADDAVFSRDLIDLAMQGATPALLRAACEKAETAYPDVRKSVAKAIDSLRKRPHRLDTCMSALQMQTVSKAQLSQAIRRVGKILAEVQAPI